MHVRCGNKPGEVDLDDIEIRDLDSDAIVLRRNDFQGGPGNFTRAWRYWPADRQNTVGAVAVTPGIGRDGSPRLRIKLAAPSAGDWPDFHIDLDPKFADRRTRLFVKTTAKRTLPGLRS
jgi:hypothetical protein